jgi:hypothetical protein
MDSHGNEGFGIGRNDAGKLKGALLCALFPVVAVMAALPFVEMGVNDDFSYTQIALRLAQTGKLVYNGWNTPMIGLQAYWAALFIKLFGFSFALVRFSALPFAAGCSVLLYLIALRAGLSRSLAIFLAFVLAFSPLAIPLEASFMTDIPGQFFTLFCVLCVLEATDAGAGAAKVAAWAALLTVVGLAGGTMRQFDFLISVFFLPYIAWWSSGWRIRVWCGICALASVIGAVELGRWFSHQLYVPVLPLLPFSTRAGYLRIADNLLGLLMELAVLLVPVTVLYIFARVRLSRIGRLILCAGSIVVAVVVILAAPRSHDIVFRLLGGNILTDTGILGTGVEVIGDKPRILPIWLQVALVALGVGLVALAAVELIGSRSASAETWRSALARWLHSTSGRSRFEHACILFTAMYCPLVASRAIVMQGFDRYLLPLLALGGILLLIRLQAHAPLKLTAAWALALLFACYGVATTHDYFACSRARLKAAQMLTQAHVPSRCISAGLEYDGWTEIALHGYINRLEIAVPPNSYQSVAGRTYPVNPPYWFWELTPTLEPAWLVVTSPQPGLSTLNEYGVSYYAWLPPFERRVLVQAAKDAAAKCGQRAGNAPANAGTAK